MAMNSYWTTMELAMNNYWATMELSMMMDFENYGKRLFIFHAIVIVVSCLLNSFFLCLALISGGISPDLDLHCLFSTLLAVFTMNWVWFWGLTFWAVAANWYSWCYFARSTPLGILGSVACLLNLCMSYYVTLVYSTFAKDPITQYFTPSTLKLLSLLEVVFTALYGALAICFVLELYLRRRIIVKDRSYLARAALKELISPSSSRDGDNLERNRLLWNVATMNEEYNSRIILRDGDVQEESLIF